MKRKDFIKTIGLGSASIPFARQLGPKEKPSQLVKPKRLKKGDTIALTAPAGLVFDLSDFEKMEENLEKMGLKVVFGEFVRERFGYFAGNDHQRALDLNRFFGDPDVDGIMAVRGGWGCARILPYLDADLITRNPKVYCGFSDNTTLHLWLQKHCNLISYHGPNGTSEWTELTRKSFQSVIMKGEKSLYKSKSKVDTVVPGKAEGVLMGGNLTILTTSLGTDYQPSLDGALLFVEDIGEPVYKLDRMLTHLKRAGMLDDINGFIFGQCTDCEDEERRFFTMKEVIKQHFLSLEIPVVMGVDISHDPDNFTIPMGVPALLDADKGVFSLLEPGVDRVRKDELEIRIDKK